MIIVISPRKNGNVRAMQENGIREPTKCNKDMNFIVLDPLFLKVEMFAFKIFFCFGMNSDFFLSL